MIRITSYNVCYTKLLRVHVEFDRPLVRLGSELQIGTVDEHAPLVILDRFYVALCGELQHIKDVT